jgi:hypothetical protein
VPDRPLAVSLHGLPTIPAYTLDHQNGALTSAADTT